MARHPARIPDVSYGRGQLDVSHTLPSDRGASYFHSAAVTNDAPVADLLVLAAVALPVLGRPEDGLAEQAILFRSQATVVDGLGLGHFSVRPDADLLWRCQTDTKSAKIPDIQYYLLVSLVQFGTCAAYGLLMYLRVVSTLRWPNKLATVATSPVSSNLDVAKVYRKVWAETPVKSAALV